jgi:hypothetical protein
LILQYGQKASGNPLHDNDRSQKYPLYEIEWYIKAQPNHEKKARSRIPGVAELVGEVSTRRVETGRNARSRATIVIILKGIVQAVRVLLAEVKCRIEELGARSNLETRDDSQVLQKSSSKQ